ncbi:MAG: hypothetical protein IKP66_01135, partial [Lachnospiraceae bacterium]|nr:hypothetical protein [Lachnospiraceae bacterium]
MATNEHIIKAPGMMKNLAVGGHLTTADQVLDDAMGKEQSQINAETATAITNEVSRAKAAEELLRQAYEALTQTPPVPVTELPESGEEGVIYRLAGETSYSDYMWNGEEFKKMAEYDNAIDDKPEPLSNNLITSDGVANSIVRQPFIGEFASTDAVYCYNFVYRPNNIIEKNINRKTTDFFEVIPGTELIYKFIGYGASLYQLIAFDENKDVISEASILEANEDAYVYGYYIVPDNVRYLRFTVPIEQYECLVKIITESYINIGNNEYDIWECFNCSYGNTVDSIYIPVKLPGVTRANFASLTPETGHSNRIILVLRDKNDSVIARSQLQDVVAQNGEVFEMKCTEAEDQSLVGTTLAYVLFNDFEAFINIRDASTSIARYNMINYKAALNIQNSPNLFRRKDALVNYFELNYPTKKTADYLNQDQYIDEVYIIKKIAEENKIIVRFTNGRVIIQDCYSIGERHYRNFAALKYFTDYSDGQVIPMTVTSTNDAETYPLGMLIGYVIIKDKAHASLVNDTTNNENYVLSKDFVYQLLNSPKIAAYLSNLDNPIAPSPDEMVNIVIPDTINAVVGDTLQLFYKSIVRCPNYKDYGIVASCNIGKSYPRYYEVTPVAGDVGDKTLTIMVYGDGMKIIAEKHITLKVINKATTPLVNKNVLLVAASTFAAGVIMPEVKRRLTEIGGTPSGLGLSNISFVGRRVVDGVHQEATGGYSWQTYATNAFKSHRFYVSGVSAVTLDATYTIEGVPIPSGVGYLVVKEVNITEGTGNILCEVYGGAVYPQGSIPANGTLVKRSGTGDN